MAKCPSPGCESAEFKSIKIPVEGCFQGMYMVVCKHCETVISISSQEIKEILKNITLKK
jgi:Fe2+ or Zn2+ uptake regulation protein